MSGHDRWLRLSALLLYLADPFFLAEVRAADFIVPSGATVGQQTLTDVGDTGVIESGGVITSVASAVLMLNADQTVINDGAVSTSGFFGAGIQSAGSNADITNGGTISTTGTLGIGIFATGTNPDINNSGAISTTGFGGFGLVSIGANATIANSGSVITSGTAGYGIYSLGTGALITNSGTISTSGLGGVGVLFTQPGTLVNAGTIIAQNANAIQLSPGDDTLTLLPGSVIDGTIALGAGTDTLNVGNGLSIANTFDIAPDILNTNGAPLAVLGTQVAVVDPTNLAMQDEILVDLTGGIFSTIHNRLDGLRNGVVVSVSTNSPPIGVGGTSGADQASDLVQDRSLQYWAQAFGSYRHQREDGPAVDADLTLGGLVSGFDGVTGSGTRIGVFFGGSTGAIEADYNSQDTDVDSLFGGLYASWLRDNTAIDFAMTAGYSDYDRTRRVANNTVAGGIQRAQADYDGWFISPELTLTRPLSQSAQRFETSATLRYAGLFLDGFTETGAADALIIGDRQVHIVQARTQLIMPSERHDTDGSTSRKALYIGLEGRAQLGNEDISGMLLGQTISFDPSGDDATAGVFAGLQFERISAGDISLYTNIEGTVETGGGLKVSGNAGIRF